MLLRYAVRVNGAQGPTQLGLIQKRAQGEFLWFFFPSPHEAVVFPSARIAQNMCFLGRKHPSSDVMFSGQSLTSYDVLEPFRQVLSASRDVIISGQICGSKLPRVFTLGDGCWLPICSIRMSSSPQPLDLDGCFSSEKPYHHQGGSLVWMGVRADF